MALLSARAVIGDFVVDATQSHAPTVLGTVETITIHPESMRVDGFLIGRTGISQNQHFLPIDCVTEYTEQSVLAHPRMMRRPADSRRVIGLSAWTAQPHLFVGVVYDCYFHDTTGTIESIVIHQVIRTWRLPVTAIVKITPKQLLIDNDTTVKLKLLPFTPGN